MLYSEATGRKMPLSATTSYAGRLVEQVGNLYRQARVHATSVAFRFRPNKRD
jgi:hypothetical protein